MRGVLSQYLAKFDPTLSSECDHHLGRFSQYCLDLFLEQEYTSNARRVVVPDKRIWSTWKVFDAPH